MSATAHCTCHAFGPPAGRAVALAARLSASATVREQEPLARHTTLRVGGAADLYVEPASEADLAATLEFCLSQGLPYFLLGRGSNLLVRDGGFRGVVICLMQPAFSRVEVEGPRLRCGAGAKLKLVAHAAKQHALAGLEFLEGIPGSVGGALRMNAGAMGGRTFDVVESVRVMDRAGLIRVVERAAVAVEYRCCPLFLDHFALGAVFLGQPGDRAEIERLLNEFNQLRWAVQPAAPSAGCIFKNPAAIPAGKLVDELGLKGTRVGGAMISHEHGNFIVNDQGGTAADVLALMDIIRAKARAERGLELENEVEIIGEN
jgi:UDP-N-acetylenolpyruvoylglucosamine reductase